jgi:endonuclease YncB( thermonuclease family)
MKPRGLLTIVASLDVTQFWPASKGTASSDGDTVHLKVNPDTSFLIQTNPGAHPKHTRAFTGAYIVDHGAKKRVITSKSEIKIRLQGIDTPELHYPVIPTKNTPVHPSKKGAFNREFRQFYGASAAKALHDHLKTIAGPGGHLNVTFVSQLDHPNQAVDSHGRFVGDIIVGTAAPKSINTWLVENGWAYPLFYDSMTDVEVQTILNAWKVGSKKAARPGKALSKPLLPFNSKMNVNNAKLPDGGTLNYPKIFRRQATFWTQVAGPLTPTEFVKMLKKGLTGKPDTAFPLAYFLANYTKLDPKKRVSLESKIGLQGQMLFEPQNLVFREDPSTLYAANGKRITGW